MFCPPVPEDHFPGGPTEVLEELEVGFLKIQGPDCTPRFSHIPQD